MKKNRLDSVVITKENIAEYYKFMSDEGKENNSYILDKVFLHRARKVIHSLKLKTDILKNNQFIIDKYENVNTSSECNHYIGLNYFEVKDTLKPINEYIAEIKESEEYKEYLATK